MIIKKSQEKLELTQSSTSESVSCVSLPKICLHVPPQTQLLAQK